MSCCGESRRLWQSPPKRSTMAEKISPPVLTGELRMAYQGDTAIVVRGPATGFTYIFPKAGELLVVDGRDVDGLLSRGDFTLGEREQRGPS